MSGNRNSGDAAKKAAAAPQGAKPGDEKKNEQTAPAPAGSGDNAQPAQGGDNPTPGDGDSTEQGGGTGDPGTTAPDGPNEPQNGDPAHSGPGTGTPAPPESTYRMPSTIVEDPDGAPLEPPSDTKTQTQPPQGHNLSSTDHVYAEAGNRTIAGEDHVGLVDEDDNEVSGDSLFDESDGSKTFVTAKKRVYEEFYYPGTREKAKRLLFAQGKKVPRAQAERIKAALENAPTPLVEQ